MVDLISRFLMSPCQKIILEQIISFTCKAHKPTCSHVQNIKSQAQYINLVGLSAYFSFILVLISRFVKWMKDVWDFSVDREYRQVPHSGSFSRVGLVLTDYCILFYVRYTLTIYKQKTGSLQPIVPNWNKALVESSVFGKPNCCT